MSLLTHLAAYFFGVFIGYMSAAMNKLYGQNKR